MRYWKDLLNCCHWWYLFLGVKLWVTDYDATPRTFTSSAITIISFYCLLSSSNCWARPRSSTCQFQLVGEQNLLYGGILHQDIHSILETLNLLWFLKGSISEHRSSLQQRPHSCIINCIVVPLLGLEEPVCRPVHTSLSLLKQLLEIFGVIKTQNNWF